MAGAMPGWIPQTRRRDWAMACALSLAAVCCAGQEPAQTYAMRGVVVNSATHQPIVRALVEVGGLANAVLTDGEGRFELHLTEGRYLILVRRPGFGSGMESRHEIQISGDVPGLTFSLTPEASITGHVTLGGGDDPDGLHFFIYHRQNVEGHARWTMMGMAQTDSGGTFRFLELETPDAYVVCSESSPDDARAATHGYAATCFPGGTDFATAAANPLTVGPGQEAELEVALARQPFYRVSIVEAGLRQGQGTSVQIRSAGGSQTAVGFARSSRPGMVEAELPNGNYYAEARTFGSDMSYGRVDFKVADGPVTGLTVNPVPLRPLMVEIHKELTAPESEGQAAANRAMGLEGGGDNPRVNLSLIPADNLFENPTGGNLRRPEGATDGDLFEMDNIVPGRYWVRGDAFEAYVSSITSGSTDLTREPLTIGPGGTSEPIEITLRNDTGTIACTVDPAESGDGATVGDGGAAGAGSGEVKQIFAYAIPQFGSVGRIPQAFRRMDGTYEFHAVAPGTYTVVAFDGRHEIDTDDRDELARIAAQGKTATVEPGGTAEVEVKAIATGDEAASQ